MLNQVAPQSPSSRGKTSDTALAAIQFIPNESFESTTENDLLDVDVNLYKTEETAAGALDPDSVASSLLTALQRSRLLTFEGEQLLFKRLNFLRFRANAIQISINPKRQSKRKLAELERLLASLFHLWLWIS